MFSEQSSSKGPTQNCGNPYYNNYQPMNQSSYSANYCMNVHQTYIYPIGIPFDNVNKDTASMIMIETKKEDEKNIEKFLTEVDQSRQIDNQSNVCKKSKISMAKDALMSVYKLNDKLKAICEELKDNQNIPEEEWQQKMNICNTARNEIIKLLEPIKDQNFLKQLKRELEKRRKKRLREKINREKWKKEKLMKMERRARMHAQIDSWIRKKQAVIEKEKQEENLRKDADMILSDVRGKRNDARKYLGLLQDLRNLRNIKANIARARGEHLSSVADEAFNNIIGTI